MLMHIRLDMVYSEGHVLHTDGSTMHIDRERVRGGGESAPVFDPFTLYFVSFLEFRFRMSVL